jgi:hypothetical protein
MHLTMLLWYKVLCYTGHRGVRRWRQPQLMSLHPLNLDLSPLRHLFAFLYNIRLINSRITNLQLMLLDNSVS